MHQVLLFLPLLSYAGASDPKSGKIVGGEEAEISTFPYQASIELHGSHFCGGAILSSYFIVTAAHCLREKNPKDLTVRVGSSNKNKGGAVYKATSIHNHPGYDKSKSNDIGIIQVEPEMKLDGTLARAISLYDCAVDEINPGETGVISGYGRKQHNGDRSDVLLDASIKILSDEDCKKAFPRFPISETMFCAAAPGKDACQGDSGGPLVSKNKLVGVISWGRKCADERYPGVYTNISAPTVRKFIVDTTGI